MIRFDGRYILITGSSRNIGLGIAAEGSGPHSRFPGRPENSGIELDTKQQRHIVITVEKA